MRTFAREIQNSKSQFGRTVGSRFLGFSRGVGLHAPTFTRCWAFSTLDVVVWDIVSLDGPCPRNAFEPELGRVHVSEKCRRRDRAAARLERVREGRYALQSLSHVFVNFSTCSFPRENISQNMPLKTCNVNSVHAYSFRKCIWTDVTAPSAFQRISPSRFRSPRVSNSSGL